MEAKSRGILLQAIPYLGKSHIMKVFTEQDGLISIMAKKTSLSPFCVAEWVYRKKQSELFTLMEGSLIDSLLELRISYGALMAAGSMAQDLLRTQLPGKGAPGLYKLFSNYLKKIVSFERPSVLAASFRVKLLLHEGLLALQTSCMSCGLSASSLREGESTCDAHSSPFAIRFTPIEWQTLNSLTFARQFSLLQEIDCPPALNEKINALFEERTR